MGSKKKPARAAKVPSVRKQVVAPPPGPTLEARLASWADKVFADERGKITQRLGIARERAFDVYSPDEVAGRTGGEGLVQGLAVLARTAEPDALVFAFVRSGLTGMPGVSAGAQLYARSGDGQKVLRALGLRQLDRQTAQMVIVKLDSSPFESYGDFTDPDYAVDPVVEARLARIGFPGANPAPQARSPSAAQPSAVAARSLLAPGSAPAAIASTAAVPTRQLQMPSSPWEAGRRHPTVVAQLCVPRLIEKFITFVPGAAPPEMRTRSLDELLSRRWPSEAQAATIIERLGAEADLRRAVEKALAAPVSEPLKAVWCAAAITLAGGRLDEPLCRSLHHEASARLATEIAVAGGWEAFLDFCWCGDLQNPLGAGLLSALVTAKSYRINLAFTAPDAADRERELDEGLADAVRLRDWLLGKVRAPAGEPGERVAWAYDSVVSLAPVAGGASREERLLGVAHARLQKVPPADSVRDYAVWHAAQLHSLVICAVLLRQYDVCGLAEIGHGDTTRRDYLPETAPHQGLMSNALDILSRHLRLRAGVLCCANDRRHVAVLARAREIDPRDAVTLGCFNEARFRAGERGDELLKDLQEEMRIEPTLGAAAELLAVAGELGNGKATRKAREKVGTLSARGPHAWIAEMRLARARPGWLADRDRVERLIATAPTGPFDPDERAVFALYGAVPADAVAEALRDLNVRREALEWDALVAELAVEEARRERESFPDAETRPKRPAPPTDVGPGAVALALDALRARLDTRAVSRSEPKPALEAHARRAAELATIEDAVVCAGWIGALAGEAGLVAVLDRMIEVPAVAPQVVDALRRADAALDAALLSSWQHDRLRALGSVWPTVVERGRSVRELRQRYDAVATAIGAAADADARSHVERELTDLMTAALALAEPPKPLVVIDDEADETPEDDAFAEMRVAPDALARSREQLSTPEWALHEGLRQVTYYNLARGKRDVKMLRGTRDAAGAIWELRHRDGRHPVRVLYRFSADGPVVIAILAKEDDAHQRRMLARVAEWCSRS